MIHPLHGMVTQAETPAFLPRSDSRRRSRRDRGQYSARTRPYFVGYPNFILPDPGTAIWYMAPTRGLDLAATQTLFQTAVTSALIAVMTGIVFGVYPARRAPCSTRWLPCGMSRSFSRSSPIGSRQDSRPAHFILRLEETRDVACAVEYTDQFESIRERPVEDQMIGEPRHRKETEIGETRVIALPSRAQAGHSSKEFDGFLGSGDEAIGSFKTRPASDEVRKLNDIENRQRMPNDPRSLSSHGSVPGVRRAACEVPAGPIPNRPGVNGVAGPESSPARSKASTRSRSACRSWTARIRTRMYSLTVPKPLLAACSSTNAFISSGMEIFIVAMIPPPSPIIAVLANLANGG